MKPYDGSGDVQDFVSTFRATARAFQWSRRIQAVNLPLCLTERAQDAYRQLSRAEKEDVDAALKGLEVQLMPSETEFLLKLNEAKPDKNQQTREFTLKLAKYYDHAYPHADTSQRNRDLRQSLKRHLPQHLQSLIPAASEMSWHETVRIVASEVPILNPIDRGESPAKLSMKSHNVQFDSTAATAAVSNAAFQRRDNNQRDTGRDNNKRDSGRDKNRRGTGRDDNWRDTGRDKQWRDSLRTQPPPASHTDPTGDSHRNSKNSQRFRPKGACGRCLQFGHYAARCTAPAPVESSAAPPRE